MTLLFAYLAVAIGVSFLCSILEAVLLSINPSFVEQTMSDKPRAGTRIAKVRDRLDESLSSILILNTFAQRYQTQKHLAGGFLPLFIQPVKKLLGAFRQGAHRPTYNPVGFMRQ